MSDTIDKANDFAQQQLIYQIKQVTERNRGIARFHCEDCEKQYLKRAVSLPQAAIAVSTVNLFGNLPKNILKRVGNERLLQRKQSICHPMLACSY